MINTEKVYEYIGNGRWIAGIPARDISAREILLRNLDTKRIEQSGLYKKVQPKTTKTTKSKKAGE